MSSLQKISVERYVQLHEIGVLRDDEWVELLRGEVVAMSPRSSWHCGCVNRLNHLLHDKLDHRAIVSVLCPLVLPESLPHPDIALLASKSDFYASGKPRSEDVLLLIEVSDSTLEKDRVIKGALYAEAGIVEYWIVNLVDDCLEVHRHPSAGKYRDVQILRARDEVESIALPGVTFAVSEIF